LWKRMSFAQTPQREEWEQQQMRAFTGWANHVLKQQEKPVHIEDLRKDLKNGLILINLVELLSEKKISGYIKDPKIALHEINNLNLALQLIKKEGIFTTNISAEDIHKGHIKLILGLFWTLIRHYVLLPEKKRKMIENHDRSQPAVDDVSVRSELLQWVQEQCAKSNVQVDGFNARSFGDGKAFAALCAAVDKRYNFAKNTKGKNPTDLMNSTFEYAEDKLDIPQLLQSKDIVGKKQIDDLSLMTYVGLYHQKYSTGEVPFLDDLEVIKKKHRVRFSIRDR